MAQTLYAALARASGDSLPKVSQILGDPHWQRLIDVVASIDRHFTEEKTGLRDSARHFEQFVANQLKFADPVLEALMHATLFHTPPSKPSTQNYAAAGLPADDPRLLSDTTWRTYEKSELPKPTDFSTIIDFHQIVAAMSSYPRLLRRMGLVIDFIVPRDAFTLAADRPLSVVLRPGVARQRA